MRSHPVSPRSLLAFTLTELLVVIGIVAVLAMLIFPAIGSVMKKSHITKSSSNLRQIGVAFQLYAGDNDGSIPAVASMENKTQPDLGPVGKDTWWTECLARYLGGKPNANRETGALPEVYVEPVLASLVGKKNTPTWRGGYSMNTRLNLIRGETFSQWNQSSSRYTRYRLGSILGSSVLVMMGYDESFTPNTDGTLTDTRFSTNISTPVPHSKRIGANNKGLGGKSALYLCADGSVRNLTPDEAKEILMLK